MRSKIALAVCVVALFALPACETLTSHEREWMDAIDYYNLEREEPKRAWVATTLNFLPGIGNFYLGQPGLGAMNLLLWPVSILWGMPQAYTDTEIINAKRTVEYRTSINGRQATCRQLSERGIVPTHAMFIVRGTDCEDSD